MRLYVCVVFFVVLHCLGNHVHAAEGLSLEFKVRSMYYDPTDPDTNPNSLGGSVKNGVPNETRADAMDTWYKANNSNDNRFHFYFGWTKTAIQPKGSICAVAWIERANDGKFIKTLGRWAGHTAHGTYPNAKKNARVYGTEVFHSPYYFVHGFEAGRAYDLSRFNGNYGNPAGSSGTNIRAAGAGSVPIHSVRGASPFDGVVTDYDSVLGPTIGCRVANTASTTVNTPTLVAYLDPDDPATTAEDASLLSTIPTIPYRSTANQPQAWNMVLEWDPVNDVDGATDLPPGDYNIIIEAVEWAMEGEYYSALVSTGGINTNQSIAFFRPKDHFKSIGYTYDGKSWTLRSGENTNDYYATDSMRREGDNSDQYSNPFTGNTLIRGNNEPAIIYDININYTPPAAPQASISNPATNTVFLQGTQINFQGTASDAEDGSLSGASLQWSSNQDGNLGTGTSYLTNGLSVNTHTINLTATDSDGQTDTDSISIVIHRPPTAVINTAAQTINFGSSIALSGSGSDPDGGAVALTWSSNLDGNLGTGNAVSPTLSAGVHTITLSVTDNYGATTSDTVLITVNNIPTAQITTPNTNTVINAGSTQQFIGSATDLEDSAAALTFAWSSDQDGALSNASSFNTATLTANATHIITLLVTDTDGASATDTVQVRVNALPTVTLSAPANNSSSLNGDSVNFQSVNNDAEGSVTSSWSSSLDGTISNSANFSTTTLSVGVHSITVTVTDSDGATASASITHTVTDPVNNPPVATISSPNTNVVIDIGDSINLVGSATDVEDGTIPNANLSWSSNLDGALGTGSSVSNVVLSNVGTHSIQLTASDSGGANGVATITVVVNGPPSAVINSPATNQTYLSGSTVAVSGSATDLEDGNLNGSQLSWSDGSNLGTGASINYTKPSGTYTITLTATDARGLNDTDTITIQFNDVPSVVISAPSDKSNVSSGTNVTFTATANDAEDGNLASNIVWTSSIDGALGTGSSIQNNSLSNGVHTITATISDSDGATSTDQINLSVGGAPVANISSPANNAVFLVGAQIDLLGSATDAQDGALTGNSLQWSSSLDGAIGSGTSVSTTSLGVGNHSIQLIATDSDGFTDTATLQITVHNPPMVSITTPSNNAVFNAGANVSMTANATDVEDGNISGAAVTWTSSVDGALGSGTTVLAVLSSGWHTITVTATDSLGASVTDSVQLLMNTPPSITIDAPSNNANYTVGDAIVFSATASDAETTPVVTWTSSINGGLGSADSITTNALSIGTHTITATVSDGTVSSNATISIQVFPASSVSETLTVQFKTTTQAGTYAPTNVTAVWIETQAGVFVKTIGRWSGERTYSLETWSHAAGNDVDAVMGATRASHAPTLSVVWDINSNISLDGIYKVWFEMTEYDTYGEGAARVANITINKNGIPQSSRNFIQNGFDIVSFIYSGRPPQISSSLSDSAASSQPYTYTIIATNGANNFSATNLPNGLSIDSASGVISGVPSGSGVYNVSIAATNAAGTDSQTLILSLDATPIITSSLLALGEQGRAFNYAINALNNPTSYAASGLPGGLSIDTNTGIISGTPSSPGSYVLSISASNSDGTDTENLDLVIGAAGVPVITSALSAVSEEGVAFNYQITATNNPSGFSASGLPPGLSINTTSGLISGAATTANPGTPAIVTINASNASGTGPTMQLGIVLHYHPSVARDIHIQITDPVNPKASDVQIEQQNATVYSGLNQTTHDAVGIDKDQAATVSFPPGGVN